MDGIKHEIISVNGIEMRVASIGNKAHPPILFLHGFPGLWYSWRRHLLYFSHKRFHSIAPDLRGYGDSDSPLSISSYTLLHFVGDILGLLDHFSIDRVFLVGHAWGAAIACAFALFRPDRVFALIALSLPFTPRNPLSSPIYSLRGLLGNDHHLSSYEEPEILIEREIASLEPESIFRFYFASLDPRTPFILKDEECGEFPVPGTLPRWVTEEDITYYASKYRKNGFHGSFNHFQTMQLNWELSAPWAGSEIQAPMKLIMGKLDYMYRVPAVMEYVQNGRMRIDVPRLEMVEIEGAGHFVHLEKPGEVNRHIIQFIKSLLRGSLEARSKKQEAMTSN